MSRIAVVGYASCDYAMACGEFRGAAGTTRITRRLSQPWPGLGGIAYAARELAARHTVHAVTWVGADEAGADYVAGLGKHRVDTSGIVAGGDRTPSCYLFYPATGETVVVYDPGDCAAEALTSRQREIIAGCDWVCLMVGPRAVTVDVLDLLSGHELAWCVKGDPDAYPAEVVRRILARASVVTFSAGERAFLELAGTRAVVAETHGPAGAEVWWGDVHETVPGTNVDAVDTTGAGDTFFAGLVASLVDRPDARLAAERGVAAATNLLRERP